MRYLTLLMFLTACGTEAETTVNTYAHPASEFSDTQQATAADCLPKALNVVEGLATTRAFPATIKINTYGPSGGMVCSAGFIAENKILTAGHCLLGANQVFLMLDYVYLEAANWKIHPDYVDLNTSTQVGTNATDIAVINLTPAEVDAYKAAALAIGAPLPGVAPLSPRPVFKGECFAWAGYGRNFLNQMSSSDQVRRVGANLMWNTESYLGYAVFYNKTRADKIVGATSAVTGQGDSGAPIYNQRGEVVGVASSIYEYDNWLSSVFADTTGARIKEFINN